MHINNRVSEDRLTWVLDFTCGSQLLPADLRLTEASDPDEPSRAANGSVSDLPRAVVPANDRGYESEKRRSRVKDGCRLHEDASDGNEGSGDWQPLHQN